MGFLVRGVAKCMCIEDDLVGYFKIDRSWLETVRQYIPFDPETDQIDYTLSVTARNDSQHVTIVYNVDRPDKPGSPSRMRLTEVLQSAIDPDSPSASSNSSGMGLKSETEGRDWRNGTSTPEPAPAKKRKVTPKGTHEDPIYFSSDDEVEQDQESLKEKRLQGEGSKHGINRDAESKSGLSPESVAMSGGSKSLTAEAMGSTVGGSPKTQLHRNLSTSNTVLLESNGNGRIEGDTATPEHTISTGESTQSQASRSATPSRPITRVDGEAPIPKTDNVIIPTVPRSPHSPMLPEDQLPNVVPPTSSPRHSPSQITRPQELIVARSITPPLPSALPRDTDDISTTSTAPPPWQEVPGASIPAIYSAEFSPPPTATTSASARSLSALAKKRESAAGAGRLFEKAMRNTSTSIEPTADIPVFVPKAAFKSSTSNATPVSAPILAVPKPTSPHSRHPAKRKKPTLARDSAIESSISRIHHSLPAKPAQANLELHGSRNQRLTSQTIASSMHSQKYLPSGTTSEPVKLLPNSPSDESAACNADSILSSSSKEKVSSAASDLGTSELGGCADKDDSTSQLGPASDQAGSRSSNE